MPVDDKQLTGLCAILALLILCPAAWGAAAESPLLLAQQPPLSQSLENHEEITIYIDGVPLAPETAIAKLRNVVFIPLGASFSTLLGLEMTSDTSSGVLAVNLQGFHKQVLATQDQSQFLADGLPRIFQETPFVQDGYLMVPARDILEAFGFSISWDESRNAVYAAGARPFSALTPGFLDKVFEIPFVEPIPAQAPQESGQAAEQPEARPFEYAFDNTFAFENIAVSGASDQSNFLPTTAFRNQFNTRFRSGLRNGYDLKGTLRTIQSTDTAENKGEVDKLALNFSKGSISADLYDFTPRFSYFTLKNYQIRGGRYQRDHPGYSVTALMGKSPKSMGDSEYTRVVQGLRVNRSKAKDRDFGFGYVRTRDGGMQLSSERVDNSVFTLNADGVYGEYTKLQAEMALSDTSLDGGANNSGNALSLRTQYRDQQMLCTGLFEKTGIDFMSETTYVTAGRRDISMMCNRKLNERTMLGTGYKAVRMGSQETRTAPFFYSVEPTKKRPDLKFTLRRNHERTFGGDISRALDVRSAGVSDTIGSVGFDVTIERRKQKETGGGVSFRNSYRYRVETFLTPKTELALQVKRERRSLGSNPRTRFYQLRLNHELKPWNDLLLSASRYYNGTINNRTDFSFGFRKINIINDWEFNIEYKFYNFRDHNDNVVRISYSFFR